MSDLLDKRIAKTIFISLWVLYASIGPGMTVVNPNAVSRIGLVFSIVQHHALNIDTFAPHTIDKALFHRHYYLDKAPGQSFTALPFVAAAEVTAHAAGVETAPFVANLYTPFFLKSVWLGAIVTSALFTAAAAATLFLLARHMRAGRQAALFGALGYALGTPAFGWATTFFSHDVAGACLFMGFALVILASDPAASYNRRRVAMLAGVLLSWSVVVEFTSAPAVLIIAAVGCWRLRAAAEKSRMHLAGAAIAGGILAALPLAIYNLLAFGSATHLAYGDVVGFDGMHKGLFGVSAPRFDILTELLVGTQRGILWIAPLLIVLPFGWFASFRRLGTPMAFAIIAIPLAYLLINSGYVYWNGGWSTGPRHVVPSLPFAGLALVALWDAVAPRLRPALLGLASASFALSLICATVLMTCPDALDGRPIPDELRFIVSEFLAGNVHHLLAPLGAGGLLSLAWLPVPVLLELLASGLLPLVRGENTALPALPQQMRG
jgi:hypothetical protein